jgi:hypothetical protein
MTKVISKRSGVLNLAIAGMLGIALSPMKIDAQTIITSGSAQVRYDQDYPLIGYSEAPTENQIARLQKKIDSGQIKLKWEAGRGYLDSLLKALDIDPSSQVLVYSKTSLQIDSIKPSTPRAIYFNEDSYVGWVQNSNLIELSVMDAKMGAVFYGLQNKPDVPVKVEREMNRCLNCHDTFSLSGGGVPRFLLSSTLVDNNGVARTMELVSETDDRTPLNERWGGWYVTGKTNGLQHLGNVLVHGAVDVKALNKVQRGTLEQLTKEFDTKPYLTDKSDIVALLVLEHQLYVKNFITRLNYKARTFVSNDLPASNGDNIALKDMSPKTQSLVKGMTNQLIKSMLFVGAADFPKTITSTSGFDKWFQAQGPVDKKGRSLRQLDLSTRLFKYPLSYVIYSEAFDALPNYAREYAYVRIVEVLTGKDTSPVFAMVAAADRKAMLEILVDTKPEFAKLYNAMSSGVVSPQTVALTK